LGIRQDTTKKGTTVTNKYQKNTPKTSSGPGLAVPDEVTIAMGEIAEDMRENLLALALAVGTGLQVMACLMEADVAAVCGPRGKHDPGGPRCATAVSAGRSPWAGVGSASIGGLDQKPSVSLNPRDSQGVSSNCAGSSVKEG